jgi:hypothetical protein
VCRAADTGTARVSTQQTFSASTGFRVSALKSDARAPERTTNKTAAWRLRCAHRHNGAALAHTAVKNSSADVGHKASRAQPSSERGKVPLQLKPPATDNTRRELHNLGRDSTLNTDSCACRGHLAVLQTTPMPAMLPVAGRNKSSAAQQNRSHCSSSCS